MIAALLLLLCSSGVGAPSVCRCDLIEFNTVYREDCDPFKQVIFWEWNQRENRYNARGWVEDCKVEILSSSRVKYGKWIIEGKIRFTETDGDPELVNRRLQAVVKPMPWGARGSCP